MATTRQDARMAFDCEQVDDCFSLVRQFVLFYYYEDSSIEMFERGKKNVFLRRTAVDIPREAFYKGGTVTIHGRPTKLTGYADDVTRQLLDGSTDTTTILVAEQGFSSLGRYMAILLEECGFTIVGLQMVWVNQDTVDKYSLPQELMGARAVVVPCQRADAVEKGFDFVRRAPGTCTALDTAQALLWNELCTTASAQPLVVSGEVNSSVVILKPHILCKRFAGSIIQQLLDAGLELTALSQMTISPAMACRFLKPYRGVLPNVDECALHMTGSVWVLQLISLDETTNVVERVRDVCGPYDPVIAKKIRPGTIRARFGEDRTRNAVHCCDLVGEGPIYSDFFFAKQ